MSTQEAEITELGDIAQMASDMCEHFSDTNLEIKEMNQIFQRNEILIAGECLE